MPPADFRFDKTKADYWRGRSEEARVFAESMGYDEPQAIMLRIAEEYEMIARWCEKQVEPTTDSAKIIPVKGQTQGEAAGLAAKAPATK
jgi:hypothetical protein